MPLFLRVLDLKEKNNSLCLLDIFPQWYLEVFGKYANILSEILSQGET